MDTGDSVLFSGDTVLCASRDGTISERHHGLIQRDARVLSAYRVTLDGQAPELVGSSQPENDRWVGVLRVPRSGGTADGPQLPQDALELRIERTVGPGMAERLTVTNQAPVPAAVSLAIDLDADFVDSLEIKAPERHAARVQRSTGSDPPALCFASTLEHDGRTSERKVEIAVEASTSAPRIEADGRISFSLDLAPRGRWSALLRCDALDDEAAVRHGDDEALARARQRDAWRRLHPALEAPDVLRVPFERAADDLADLRNFELERRLLGRTGGSRWVLNAGMPMFTGLFGRDVITAGWQSVLLGPRALRGALDAVAATAATGDDPWRDAEPGKLIHELRSGPLAEVGLTPRDAYYGSQTTPALFVLALSELWHWTGDIDDLRRHRDTAVAALAWAERYGDADRDGFIEYQRRSPAGLRNQGWKDSDEAIRHEDGSAVDGPVATVEEQAFRILALERMAEIHVALGEDEPAERCLTTARRIRASWHERYWMPDLGFYALALDGDKQQVRSITSNPGHALGAGVVPRELSKVVADRLLADDLFSGWGVRSLSADHPSYNPFAYHLGAVWPVEQATFALGCKRYGLDAHADRIVEAQLAAAAASPGGRVPEAFSGHARRAGHQPVPYPGANSPQAWSASAIVQLVQITLGLYPFAPLRMLAIVRPRLPEGVDELVLRSVRVGRATVDLRFRRRDDGSAEWAVVRRHGPLVVVPMWPPEAEPANLFEGLEKLALGVMPGRLARAARIAVGLD
jgi:glycogen debranching enzyme